jgi:hypothetical protein
MQLAYRRISGRFKINGNTYPGEGIASADALYLIIKGSARRWWMVIPGGIIGWLVAQSTFSGIDSLTIAMCASVGLLWLLVAIFMPDRPPQAPVLNSDLVRVTAVKDLSDQVRRHANWPYERTKSAELRPVVIIPKSPQVVMDHKKYSNLLSFKIDGIDIQVDYLIGQGADILDFLAANGWSLIWAGEQITAPPAPSETDAGILVSP